MVACLMLAGIATPGAAQEAQTGSPPERIDLTVATPQMRSTEEECERQRDAAIVSGEIVVCGATGETSPRYSSNEEAEDRYAAATMGPMPVDVESRGLVPMIGAGVIIRGCFIPPCPKPPALIVDVAALPEAPPGSDADRIARGLAPLGEEGEGAPGPTPGQRAELGLPESPVTAEAGTSDRAPGQTVSPEPKA